MKTTTLAVAVALMLGACDAETLAPCGLQGDVLVCGNESVGPCREDSREPYTEESGSCFRWNGLCCDVYPR